MAIRHLIARGIGFSPGSVEFIVTHGIDGPEVNLAIFPVESLMRSTTVRATGAMSNSTVALDSPITDKLPVESLMRSTPVHTTGAMSNAVVSVSAELH